ncbi:unnamed protein product [Urochloa decumbens]|uniref:F-box domain-containing protein n=1 Tax=Urochloa decumbens TaxID=240449 RepID=A0ABC8WVN0_9POAL
MQPPGRERPPSSSSSSSPPLLSKRIRLITREDDDGGETTGSVALVSPLENDDLVADSLLFLPALPSSLLRASLVCKRWCRVLSNPRFLRDFHAHHGNPPLLGLFYCNWGRIIFTPMLDPPDEIPPRRFALGVAASARLLSCNHGRLLIHNEAEGHFLVWDPVTGELCRIPTPPWFRPNDIMFSIDGAVVCASTDQGHVHGACHSDPFRIVIVAGDGDRFYGCSYSSETKAWGNLFSEMRPPHLRKVRAPTCSKVFWNSIFSLIIWGKLVIVEFDWARQNLALIDAPYELGFYDFIGDRCQFLMKPSDGGGISFIVQEAFTVRVWKRKPDGDGVATWMLANTIDMNSLLSLGLPADSWVRLLILALDDDGNVLFKMFNSRVVFMVNLESREFKKLPKTYPFIVGHPFSSFYTPGMHINTGRADEAQNILGL